MIPFLLVLLFMCSTFHICDAGRGWNWRAGDEGKSSGRSSLTSPSQSTKSKSRSILSPTPKPKPQPSPSPPAPHGTAFNVLDFGAKGDGTTDDTKAFQAAWAAACEVEASKVVVPSKYEFLVGPISFDGPNCEDNIVFQLDGTIIAPTDPKPWGSGLLQWLEFKKLKGLTIQGQGIVEGQGNAWWSNKSLSDDNAQPSSELSGKMPRTTPTALRLYGSSNVTVTGIAIRNSPQCHLKFDSCDTVEVSDITISSPGDSPNTDGIHLQNSLNVFIHDVDLGCGDDCISIQTGCSSIYMHTINCGPGHGISIGGLGKDNTEATVSNITVQELDTSTENRNAELYVECTLYIDGGPFGLSTKTRLESSGYPYLWNELITLSSKYRDLTSQAQLAFTVWDVSCGNGDGLVGGATVFLFNSKKQLKAGRQKLRLWPGKEADGTIPTTTPGKVPKHERGEIERLERLVNKYERGQIQRIDWLDRLTFKAVEKIKEKESGRSDNSHLSLVVDFCSFEHRVVFQESGANFYAPSPVSSTNELVTVWDPEVGRKNPSELKQLKLARSLTRGIIDRDLKPSSNERKSIQRILKYPPTRTLSGDERQLLWKFRFSLMSEKRALTKFLRCVEWTDVQEAKQAIDLMGKWETIDVADALELLSPVFESEEVWDVSCGNGDGLVGGATVFLFNSKKQLKAGRQKLRLWPGKEADGTIPTTTPGKVPKHERGEIERLERLVNKYERGQIQRIDWLDRLTFKAVEKIKEKESGRSDNSHLSLVVDFCSFEHRVVFQESGANFYAPSPVSSTNELVTVWDPEVGRKNPSELKQLKLARSLTRGIIDRDLKPSSNERKSIQRILKYPPTRTLSGDERQLLWKFRFSLMSEKRALTKFLRCVEWTDVQEAKQAIDLMGKWETIDVADALELLSPVFESEEVRAYAVSVLERAGDDELQCYLLQLVQALRFERSDKSSLSLFLVQRSLSNIEIASFLRWYVAVELHDPTYAKRFYCTYDMLEDNMVIQMVTLMDRLLKLENLDLHLTPYRVLATGQDEGMVEFIPSSSLAQKFHPDEDGPFGITAQCLETFIKSCAGYSVITYILGIGDRHLDNLLLRDDGRLFHVDFGFILGRDPKPFPPPMKLCKEMVEAMGGAESQYYTRFKSYCCEAYNILRKSSNLILNLFHLMAGSNIPDIASDPEKGILKELCHSAFHRIMLGGVSKLLDLLVLWGLFGPCVLVKWGCDNRHDGDGELSLSLP
ncbi:hypothetical protein COCNU_05G010220 [Cocos nucifera]|uniref:Phosphatidylinositol 3-kinase n=1 Tax=Cocos nucifera TaxID=13894 RepID=A0A8K0N249_COCNU|nr:hypothetical protein COCNU_05G010220 [Cocos nucifera]